MRIASTPFWAATGTPIWCLSKAPWGRDTGAGRQILPGEDGFFYALLRKAEAV
jgi:hypothetical protein